MSYLQSSKPQLKRKTFLAGLVLLLIFLTSSWSLLRPGFFRVHDFTHGGRIAEMTRALQDGQFPVRWTQNFGFGYGMPLFQFYSPLPFYFASIFYWLGLGLVPSIKIMVLLATAGTVVGGYLLGRELAEDNQLFAGLVTSAALTLAPYRAVNLYIRGAFNEIWGLAAFPFILWSIIRVIKGKTNAWISLSLSLLVLFLSHNVSVIIFAPFAAVFVVVYLFYYQKAILKKSLTKSKLITVGGKLVLGGLLAVGLSSFYLMPAFFEKSYTQVDQIILTDYFDYKLHFLYLRQFLRPNWGYGGSEWGPDDKISFFLGYGQTLLLLLSTCLFTLTVLSHFFSDFGVVRKIKAWFQTKYSLLLFFFLAMAALAILLTTEKTRFIWDNLSLMAYIQFPWRFMMVLILMLAAASSLFVASLKKYQKQFSALIVLILVVFNFWYFRPESFLDDPKQIYYADPARIRNELSGILPDYIPAEMPFWKKIEPVENLVLNQQLTADGRVKVLINRSHEKLISVNLDQAQDIELGLASYPGWQASTQLSSSDEGHFVLRNVSGRQRISLRYTGTSLVMVSDIISLLSLITFIYLIVKYQFITKGD